jgi:predicted NBD/HSP70 family sugar kinase
VVDVARTAPRSAGIELGLRTPAAVDVFTRILTHGPIGRLEAGRQTGLTAGAVTRAVAPLIARGLIREDSPNSPARGRPIAPLRIDGTAAHAIGVKVTEDAAFGVVTTLTADVVDRESVELDPHSYDAVIDAVAALVRRLRDRSAPGSALLGLGVTVSGDVDGEAGIVRDSPLLGWREAHLGARLAGELDLQVVVENDVRALAYAEQWFGVGRDADSFAIMTIGAGIGCGLYVNGGVVEGSFGVAGEIGHLPLADPAARCVCGRSGCVEAVASTGAIVEAVRAAHGERSLELGDAIRLAHTGDAAAVAAFDGAGRAIGAALAAMVNLVGPEIVLVAGEGVAEFDLYEQRIREEFEAHAFGSAARCELRLTSHTFDDWARGAAVALIRSRVRRGV